MKRALFIGVIFKIMFLRTGPCKLLKLALPEQGSRSRARASLLLIDAFMVSISCKSVEPKRGGG